MTDIVCELKDCKWYKGHFCGADHIELNQVSSSIGNSPEIGVSKEWREGYYCKRDHHLYCYNYSSLKGDKK